MRKIVPMSAALSLVCGGAFAQAPAQPAANVYAYDFIVPIALMAEAAKTAIDTCRARGAEVAVSIRDTHNIERVVMVSDGARPYFDVPKAQRKAFTALSDGGNLSSDMYKSYEKEPGGAVLQMTETANALPVAGGVPMKINKVFAVAAIGVSGSPQPVMDEECALAGVAKIQARLDTIKYR